MYFNATLGSHCKANIIVRSDSIAIQFLLVFNDNHVGFNHLPLLRLSKLCQPHKVYIKMVELWGTAPQSKTTILQRIQNHHHFHGNVIINIHTGNCKFLSYNMRINKMEITK